MKGGPVPAGAAPLVSRPLFADRPDAFARAVGAGLKTRAVLLPDDAGWHTRPDPAVPDGLERVYLPPCSPEPQRAETLWTLVDEPVVDTSVPDLTEPIDTITERCTDLTTRRSDTGSG